MSSINVLPWVWCLPFAITTPYFSRGNICSLADAGTKILQTGYLSETSAHWKVIDNILARVVLLLLHKRSKREPQLHKIVLWGRGCWKGTVWGGGEDHPIASHEFCVPSCPQFSADVVLFAWNPTPFLYLVPPHSWNPSLHILSLGKTFTLEMINWELSTVFPWCLVLILT